MTTIPSVPETFIEDLKKITRLLTVEAHSADVQRRVNAGRWLGHMKYDHERATKHPAPRSPGHEALYQIATAKLSIIDDFIAFSAETDHLLFILEGMVGAINGHATDPTLVTTFADAARTDLYAGEALSDWLASAAQDRLGNVAHDFRLADEPDRRQRAAFRLGSLKHDGERALRNPGELRQTAGVAGDHEQELAVIDALILKGDDKELRSVIGGFAAHIRV